MQRLGNWTALKETHAKAQAHLRNAKANAKAALVRGDIDRLPPFYEIPQSLKGIQQLGRWDGFCRNHSAVDPELLNVAQMRLFDLGEQLHLSAFRLGRLFIKLQRLASSTRLGFSLEGYERAANPIHSLKKVEKSLGMLSEFSVSLLNRDTNRTAQMAFGWIQAKLEREVGNRRPAKINARSQNDVKKNIQAKNDFMNFLQSYGFTESLHCSTPREDFFDYGSHIVLARWLRMTVMINELLKPMIAEYSARAKLEHTNDEPSEVEFLYGKHLTSLLKEYAPRSGASGRRGLQLLQLFVSVMCLEAVTEETVRRHLANYRSKIEKISRSD